MGDFVSVVLADTEDVWNTLFRHEGLKAASAVSDDRIQEKSQGYVVPDSFTHGTSRQRAYWFVKGLKSGDVRQGNTFAAKGL